MPRTGIGFCVAATFNTSQLYGTRILIHLISFPAQVCLARPGWYERCVALVQRASHRGPLQPLGSAHVWLWFREGDMIDSPDGALQLFSNSVQCGSRSPRRSRRLWAHMHTRLNTSSYACTAHGRVDLSPCSVSKYMHRIPFAIGIYMLIYYALYWKPHTHTLIHTFDVDNVAALRNDQLSRWRWEWKSYPCV